MLRRPGVGSWCRRLQPLCAGVGVFKRAANDPRCLTRIGLNADRLGPGDRVREADAHGGAHETVGSSHCPHPTWVRLRIARGKVPRRGMFDHGVPTLKGGYLRRIHGNVGEHDGKLLEMSDWLATRTGRWM